MKLGELIRQLENLYSEHGDVEVFTEYDDGGLQIGVDSVRFQQRCSEGWTDSGIPGVVIR